MQEETVAACINAVLQDAKPQSRNKSKQNTQSEGKPKKDSKVPLGFSESDLKDLEIIIELLQPLAELTDDLQADKISSSLVIPGIVSTISCN